MPIADFFTNMRLFKGPAINGRNPTRRTKAHTGGGQVADALQGRQRPEQKWVYKRADEIEKDPIFLFGSKTIKSLVQSADVSFDGVTDERSKALADSLLELYRTTLPTALKAFGYGRTAFELVWRWAPLARLQLIESLDHIPEQYSEMTLEDGQFAGVRITGTSNEIELDKSAVWWFALDPTAIYPHGQSRYEGAPEFVWNERKKLWQQQDQFIRRFALGQSVLYGPAAGDVEIVDNVTGTGDVGQIDEHGDLEDPINDVVRELVKAQSGGVTGIPGAFDREGNQKYKVERFELDTDASPLSRRRTELDNDALYSICVPPRAITQDEGTGTYAMARVHFEVLQTVVEDIAGQLGASFQNQVVDRATGINGVPPLKLNRQPIDLEQVRLALETVQAMLTAPQPSPLITHGVVDVERLFKLANVPTAEAEEILTKLAEIRSSANGDSLLGGGGPVANGRLALSLAKLKTEGPSPWDVYREEYADEVAALLEGFEA